MKNRLIIVILTVVILVGSIAIWTALAWVINLVIPIGIPHIALIGSSAVLLILVVKYIRTGE